MARPKTQPNLTPAQVQGMAALGCTDAEIAVLAGVSERTMQRHFDAHLKAGRASLRHNLRKRQVERALEGSDTMLIWMGKQYLGQRDQQQIVADVTATVKGYQQVSPDDWDGATSE